MVCLLIAASYLGDIVEWWGFAVAATTLHSLTFATLTTHILGSRDL